MVVTISPIDVHLLVSRDQRATRCEYQFPLPRAIIATLLPALEDPRDETALNLVGNVVLTTLPAALALFCFNCRQHWVGLAYFVANYVLYMQRFMLTLHFTEHRRLFRSEHVALNAVLPYVLCVLFGVPTGVYRFHHCIMHHVEENASNDISSTEPFQRDSFLHFLVYWMRYAVGAWFELPAYALKRRRFGWAAASVTAESAYWLVIAALWRINPVATLWTLVVPFVLTSFLAMFGNWSQHAFVNAAATHGAYKSAYNCVDHPDNQRTYNDGYHIVHHANSRLHWSQMPQTFLDTLPIYAEQDALVFHGVGFFDVGLAVFTGRLGFLADHIVPCGARQAKRSRSDWVMVLKERLKPLPRSSPPS